MTNMERRDRLKLIERSLGLRHKLKVHESMNWPENHDEMAVMLLAKWELEDELKAVEELLSDDRTDRIDDMKKLLLENVLSGLEAKARKQSKTTRKKKSTSKKS